MTVVAVLAPVLDRPQRAQPLADSLAASTLLTVELVFLCSRGDDAEIAACRQTGARTEVMEWEAGQGDYARKLNWGVEHSDSVFVFFAADDLVFHGGWAERAVAAWYASGACVIGTNDLGNQRVVAGRHSTHTLVHRNYRDCGTIDESDRLLHEGYWHNYVDDEFVQTAISRGTYSHAPDAVVEHLHPDWGKGQRDATYERGLARFRDDHAYFERRRRLWQ